MALLGQHGIRVLNGMRYFDDDGTEFNPDLIPSPDLCVSCSKNDDPDQEALCNLTRADTADEEVFLCFAYAPASPNIDREAVLRDLCEQAGAEYPEDSPDEGGGEPVSF